MKVRELIKLLDRKTYLDKEVRVIYDGEQKQGCLTVRDLDANPTAMASGHVILWTKDETEEIPI